MKKNQGQQTQPDDNAPRFLKAAAMENQLEHRIKGLKQRHDSLMSESLKVLGQVSEAEFWLNAIRNSKPSPDTLAPEGADQPNETIQ